MHQKLFFMIKRNLNKKIRDGSKCEVQVSCHKKNNSLSRRLICIDFHFNSKMLMHISKSIVSISHFTFNDYDYLRCFHGFSLAFPSVNSPCQFLFIASITVVL